MKILPLSGRQLLIINAIVIFEKPMLSFRILRLRRIKSPNDLDLALFLIPNILILVNVQTVELIDLSGNKSKAQSGFYSSHLFLISIQIEVP